MVFHDKSSLNQNVQVGELNLKSSIPPLFTEPLFYEKIPGSTLSLTTFILMMGWSRWCNGDRTVVLGREESPTKLPLSYKEVSRGRTLNRNFILHLNPTQLLLLHQQAKVLESIQHTAPLFQPSCLPPSKVPSSTFTHDPAFCCSFTGGATRLLESILEPPALSNLPTSLRPIST